MNLTKRSTLAVGILLVLVGVYFILANLVPAFNDWLNITMSWPLIVVAVGVGLLVLGLLVGAPDMAIPAVIVGGIGGILYYQNLCGNWASWSYLWTLIPGFSGIGMLLANLLGARGEHTPSFSIGYYRHQPGDVCYLWCFLWGFQDAWQLLAAPVGCCRCVAWNPQPDQKINCFLLIK